MEKRIYITGFLRKATASASKSQKTLKTIYKQIGVHYFTLGMIFHKRNKFKTSFTGTGASKGSLQVQAVQCSENLKDLRRDMSDFTCLT